VFQSLGLIKKTHLVTRKPAFMWVGFSGLDNFIASLKQGDLKKKVNRYTPNKAARDAFRSVQSAFKTPKTNKTKSMTSSL